MAFKVIVIVIELMFLAINMFLALLRAHFNPRYARAKMILSRTKNIFMPAHVNSIVIMLQKTARGTETTGVVKYYDINYEGEVTHHRTAFITHP